MTLMVMAEEIDVLEYVRWLFLQLKPLQKMPTTSDGEAVRAARLLSALAPLSEEPDTIQRLAYEICALPLRVGDGKAARVEEAREFLERFQNHLGPGCEAALRLLRRTPLDKAREEVRSLLAGQHGEYRDASGGALDRRIPPGAKQSSSRFVEELTLRIWDAYSALKESGCPKPYAVICDVLNTREQEYWSPQRVESRLKPFRNRKARTWRTSLYRFRFWGWKTDRWCDEEQPFAFRWRELSRADGKPGASCPPSSPANCS